MSKISDIFKSHLKDFKPYKGGKSRDEIASKGKKIYKLSSNENILGPSPLALRAIQNELAQVNQYPDRTDTKLRNALSAFYKETLSPKQFFTANSGVDILDLICRAFLDHKSEVIISSPTFKPYILFAKKMGAKVIDIPLSPDDFSYDADAVLAAINENTRLVFLTNPNNPTGNIIPKQIVNKIINEVPDHVAVVHDEVYFQFAEEQEEYSQVVDQVNEGKAVIAVNSFSKAYGLAGMRVGYAYTTEEIAQYVSQFRRPFMLNKLGLAGAIAALKDEEFINKTKDLVKEEKAFIYDALDELQITYWKTAANFILIKPAMEDKVFEAKMLEEGIMVRPVANFGAEGCIRVTIGNREANNAYIIALKKVLNG